MTQLNTLLELRNKIKNKKPDFIRQDNPKRPKLNDKWRKPKGIHSKIRHQFKGRRKMPSPGYKSPRKVKGLHNTGLEMIRIISSNEIKNINNKTQGIIVPKSIGTRKRLEMLKTAKQLDVKVLNLSIEETIKKIENFINSKKKEAKETKKEIKKEAPKKAEELEKSLPQSAEKQEIKPTDEEKKEAEKKEKDKVLTKRM